MNNRITILNVDDSPALRYNKTRTLQAAGYDVVEADTGAAALRLAHELQPELVLCDVKLPDMSGIEVCRQLKAHPVTANLPIIQISATFITEKHQQEGLRGGADIYLTEPLEPKVLETVVQVLLQLRRTEAGLKQTEARWQRLVDSNVVGVVIVEDGRIVEANERFQKMVGYDAAELSKLTLTDITPAESHPQTQAAQRDVLTLGSCAPFEKRYTRKDGALISAVVSAVLIDERRRRWLALVLDVSERNRIEAEREEALHREQLARQQAEEATRLKDDFLANLSHELRTPMNIIIGWAHLLRNGPLSEEQKNRATEAIERAARSQAQLIEDLLDVSRIVTGKFRLQMQDVNLGMVLKSAVDNLRLVASTKQITVNLSQEAPGARVRGDPDRLQQVFWNLLTNAVKFTPSEGCVDVRLYAEGSQVLVSVTDTGVGIAPDFLPHVFDRFRQADSTSTRQHTGMGLGLAIVRHVVELHGGSVRADSAGENSGSTFTVSLPRLSADPDIGPGDVHGGSSLSTSGGALASAFASASIRASARRAAGPSKAWRVLLVDDDEDGREMTVAGLQRAGFELRAVSTATQALALLDYWLPDVIVSDIRMPGMNGYEFMRALRARPPERGGQVAALALTGFARLEDAVQARDSGFQGHLAKPISSEDLAAAVARVQQSAAAARS
jgi:PAS domain S-box-containing protein